MFRLRFQDLLDTAFSELAGGYTFAQVIVNVVVAVICGLIIYYVYRKTYSGVLFSKNVGTTMVIVTVITSLMVMAIHGNLALSLGMIGALSIVRFRTPVKDPKDLAFFFWAVATGVTCGISAYKLAFIGAFAVGTCLFVLSKVIRVSQPYLLIVKMEGAVMQNVKSVLKNHCEKFRERSSTSTKDSMEVVFEVVLKKLSSVDLLGKFKAVSGIEKAVMVSYEGDLDESP